MSNTIQSNLLLNIETNSAELKKGINQVNQHLNKFKSQVGSAGTSIKGLFAIEVVKGVAQAIGSIINFGKELSVLGGQFTATANEFKNLNQPDLLKNLRTETQGTISDLKLMQMSLNADDMGVGFEDLTTIINYARNEVRQTGGDVTELTNKLVNGIGKDSVKAINELGISNTEFNEEFQKTGDKTTAITNIMKKRLSENGGVIETSADITARWGAEWENLKTSVGVFINKGIEKIAPIIDELYQKVKTFFKESLVYIVDFINGWIELYNESETFRQIVESIGLAFKFVWGIVKIVFSSIIDVIQGVGRILGYVLNPKNWGKDFGKGLKEVLKKSDEDMRENFTRFGEEISESFTNSIERVKRGKISLIDLNSAEEEGTNTGKKIKKKIQNEVKKIKVEKVEIELNDDFAKNFDFEKFEIPNLEDEIDERIAQPFYETSEGIEYLNNQLSFTKTGIEKISDAFGSVTDFGSSLSNLFGSLFGEDFKKNMDESLQGLYNFINGFINLISVIESINKLFESFGSLITWITTLTELSTVSKQKNATASLANASASSVEAGSDAVGAAAKGARSVAGIPIVGAILAAAAFAMIIGAFIKARKQAKGYYSGGVVDGSSNFQMVGEQGAELLQLPVGSRIYSNGRTKSMLNNIQPKLEPVVLTTQIKGSDLYLIQKRYNERITYTR